MASTGFRRVVLELRVIGGRMTFGYLGEVLNLSDGRVLPCSPSMVRDRLFSVAHVSREAIVISASVPGIQCTPDINTFKVALRF